MDPDQKDLIEKASKSDYFDKVLEIQIQKKASEILQRRKWPIVFIAGLFLLLTGYNFYDILLRTPQIKSVLESQIAALEGKLSSLESKSQSMDEEMNIRKAQIGLFDSMINNESSLSQKYVDFFNSQYGSLIKQINDSQQSNKNLSDSVKNHVREARAVYNNILAQRDVLNGEIEKWKKVMVEVIKLSSTVHAYVERGSRDPEKWGFRPTYVDLPYSNNRLQIIFTKAEKRKEQSQVGDYKERAKFVEITVVLLDSLSDELTRKNLLLKESSPIPIPGTDHEIMAQFVYLPPNPIVMIPDFVILAISPKEEYLKNLQYD